MAISKLLSTKKYFTLLISIIGLSIYGVFVVFAAPPNGGYTAGTTLDPDCIPGDTDCLVAISGGLSIGDIVGNNPDLNGVLYTNSTGQITTDDLFTRDAITKDTTIGKDFVVSTPQFDIEVGVTIVAGNFSNPFNSGDTVVGGTSNATGTFEYYDNSIMYLSNVSGTFINGETITDTTINETATVSQVFNSNSFSLNDTVKIYNPSTNAQTGTGTVTAVNGSTYTITVVGTIDLYYLLLDQLQNPQKAAGILDGGPAAPVLSDAHGSINISDSLLGGLLQGIGSYYSNDNGTKFALSYVGSAFGGGDTYSVGSIVGNQVLNNYANMGISLIGRGGSPEVSIGVTDALNNHNSNLLMNQNRIVLQNNQNIALLAKVQIGSYDYNNDDPDNPLFPAYSNYYYLPQSRGTIGQVLTEDGNGNTYWADPSSSLIGSTSDIATETWLGQNAGGLSGSSSNTVFIGIQAGYGATNAGNSNFIGRDAGREATDASYSNFFGQNAGYSATNAVNSNFIGSYTGYGATDATYSNFFGQNAGYIATAASNSNFFGNSAGYGATDASNSNFFGQFAGNGAYNADNSNFLGQSAGQGATGANNSNFLGYFSGYGATGADKSNFFGYLAGQDATGASGSNFIGDGAGWGATNAFASNFFGGYAGRDAINADRGVFIGSAAGWGATNAELSNFIGGAAGQGATDAIESNFFGYVAGGGATYADHSNFFGTYTGHDATDADHSNFFGDHTGQYATYASESNFFGRSAGALATNASNSNFIGSFAGGGATNASNSIFIGQFAGNSDIVNNTGNADDFSILIGKSTSTGGHSNSIAIGGSATNTSSNQFMIGSTTRPINTLVLTGASGNTCTLDVTVASPSCSSDERLKTNIEDLTTDTLDKVINIKTVSYDWNNFPDKGKQIGFLAQDLEQYFPEVVSEAPNGFKTVSYGGMTPILVQAIREMNLKITTINNTDTPNSWRDAFIAWFGNTANGITDLFTKRIHTDELCVGTVCVTQDQFLQMVNNSGMTISSGDSNSTVTPDPEVTTNTDSVGDPDITGDNTNTDTGEIPDVSPTENNPVDSSDTPVE